MEALLTVADLARFFRKSEQAVYLMRHEGKLPPAVKIGRSVYWEPETFRSWLEANREAVA